MKLKQALPTYVATLLSLSLGITWARGQEAEPIDVKFLNDLAATRSYSLGRPSGAKVTPDGKAVLFLRCPARSPVNLLYEYDLATKQTKVLLTPEQLLKGAEESLTPEERARRERSRTSARGFASYQMASDGQRLLVSLSGKLYVFDRTTQKTTELPTGVGAIVDPKFSPDGTKVAYVRGEDVYYVDLNDLKERAVTSGGTADVTHGLAEFVAQEEMDRHTGYWWSPDGKWLAYEEADNRDVELWRIPDPFRPDQEPHKQRYPRAGKNNAKVRLGITSVEGGQTTWVQWDDKKFPYMATVKWMAGGPLTVVVQTRDQKELVVYGVDQQTGATTHLVTEKDEAWVNLDQSMPHWLADGSGFLWTSEREGAWQLELRDAKGQLTRVLVPPTSGLVHSHWLPGHADVDLKKRRVYFLASKLPTQAQVAYVSLDGGSIEFVKNEPGLQSATFAKDFGAYVLRSGSLDRMPTSMIYLASGEVVGELPSVAETPPVKPNTEIVHVGADPGFYCSVTRPRDFDKTKRYPVIMETYGGPGVQTVSESMASRFRSQWFADQGFIVVTVDNRGTPGRGRVWERAIKASFGAIPLDDQVTALKALGARFREIDLDRVGMMGWSFGGYVSALAVLKRPDVFRAGVAGAPVSVWEDYDTHYTERYLGMPGENTAGYSESSLLTYARDLKRPLLLVHGTADDNVFMLHTLKLSDALMRAGKDHEVLPMAGFAHGVSDPAARARLDERTVKFFRKHLGRPE